MRVFTPLKFFRKNVLANLSNFQTSIRFFSADIKCWRVLFYGTEYIECLEALNTNRLSSSSERIVESLSVVCKNMDCKVQRYATENSLTIHTWPCSIPPNTYDVGVVDGFGHLIPSSSIQACKYGMINLHPSLLPRWRGAAPIHHTILNGDGETGVTIMQIAPKKFDVGNILLQETYKIPDPDRTTVEELTKVLKKKGAEMIMRTLKDLPNSINSSSPQPEEGVTYAPKLEAYQGCVNWNEDTVELIQRKLNTFKDIFPVFSYWKDKKVVFVECLDKNVTAKIPSLLTLDVSPGFIYFHEELKLIFVKCKFPVNTYWKDKKVVFVNCLDKNEVKTAEIPSLLTLDVSPGYIYFHEELKLIFVKCKGGWCGVVKVKLHPYGIMPASRFYKNFIRRKKDYYFISPESGKKRLMTLA
ncbi:methionyl-tRNA formyltransferase, mitochondrial isoform X2 [Parasteatoda tepidariorum]|uniref:methionyl-tRNA formyltransferase, mitochondrial isoform X2 n=1 Tax=Parasteatoda tepidariorum TaxID=114398 RepID=UPI0039BCC1AF